MIYLDYFHFVMIFSEKQKVHAQVLKRSKRTKRYTMKRTPDPQTTIFINFCLSFQKWSLCVHVYIQDIMCVSTFTRLLLDQETGVVDGVGNQGYSPLLQLLCRMAHRHCPGPVPF